MALRFLPRACAFVLGVALVVPGAVAAPRPAAGDAAPTFVGDDAEAAPVSLADFGGRVVVLSFWASWCAPCLKELPILDGIQRTAGKRRLQVVAINIERVDVYRKVARRLGDFDLLVTHDRDRKASEAYGVKGIPHLIIVGRDGRIVRVNRGYDESALDDIVTDINRALGAQ